MSTRTVPAGAASARAIALEDRVTAPNYHPVDVVLERGAGEWLYDVEGRRYLDLMSAYSAVSHGHSHPRLVAALHAQAQKLAIASRAYRSATMGPFLEKLVAITGLEMAMPANGGVESVESAIKAARRWGYQVKGIPRDMANIVVARGNFHGRTTTVISFSSEADYQRDFGPLTPGFRFFEFGDIDSLAAAVDENTCAVLFEPIQGESGVRIPPDGFLRAARALCDERRALLLLDEIQSGLGRTGRWFACEHEGVRPDGIILGKALGGGLLPVSAFVSTRAVLGLMKPGSHGTTFGGNALASAVGLEALRVLEDEKLVERSARLGVHLLARLRGMQASLPPGAITMVRGRGLWAGVELDPAVVSARAVVEEMARRGVLTKETHETVIRFAPPLVIAEDSLEWGLGVFADVVTELARPGR
jgi:ornithine--oxo-acid transaminase